jgi:hypothetical protein
MKCEAEPDSGTISCVVENDSSEAYFILLSPFGLEGPKGGDEYFYKHTGGERIENTLEYGYPEAGPLGEATLFFPNVHLKHEDLSNLCRLEPGAKAQVLINLAEVRKYLAGSAEWNFRPKIVAAKEARLTTLAESADLQEQCKTALRKTLSNECSEVLKTTAAAPWEGIQYTDDGCLDRISMQFEHVYASEILFTNSEVGVSGSIQ